MRTDYYGKASDTAFSSGKIGSNNTKSDRVRTSQGGCGSANACEHHLPRGGGCDWSCISKQNAPHGKLTMAAMKTAGYHGTPDFTYQDALTFASETEAGYMMVCQNTLNQTDSYCKNNDPWTKAGPLTAKEAIGILAIPVIVLGIGVLAECGPAVTICANAAGWAGRAIGSAILGGLGGEGGKIPGAAPAAAIPGTSALRGVDDVLSGLSKGKQSFVRTVPDEASLTRTFGELTERGTPTTWKNFSGTVIERGDGVQVGLRSYSKSGGPTIDIRMPDGQFYRIHVDQ
jgi:hypothetical protein